MEPILVALNIHSIIVTLKPTSKPHHSIIIVYIAASMQPN